MADSKNILALSPIPTGAAVAVAELGTTLPTDATSVLNVAFEELGWVTDDGVTNSVKRDTTKHYAWGGEVVKVTMDKYTETLKVSLYESSTEVLQTVFGFDNVTIDDDAGHVTLAIEHSSLMLPRQSFVFTYLDGEKTGRTVVREGQITEIDDIVLVHNKPTVYGLTIDVFKTEDDDPGVVQYFDYADVLSGS